MMRKIVIILLLISSIHTFGQRWKYLRHELVFGGGSANFFGDIGGAPDANKLLGLKDFRFSDMRYNAYIGWNYRYSRDISVKYNLVYAAFTSTDAGSKNAARGLSFSTNLFELSAQGQYYLFNEYRRKRAAAAFNRRGAVASYLSYSIYGFAGVGMVYYNAKISGPPVYLDPNDKSRKSTGFSPVSMVFPVGIGGSWAIGKRWLAGLEVGPRISISDGLDSYNTIWSKSTDVYWFATITGTYKLKTDRYGYPVFFKKMMGMR